MNKSSGLTRIIVCIFSVLAIFSTSVFADKPSQQSIQAIDTYLQSVMDAGLNPGISVSIYHKGLPVFEKGYGFANLEWKNAVKPETVFEIGSISKTFTSLAIHLLAEDGKLSLDDTLGKHLPKVPESMQQLTLRNVLTHISGLGDFTSALEYQEVDQNPKINLDQAFEIVVNNTTILFAQGESWAYSNSGTWLLSYLIEKVSEQSYAQFIQERIFTPLGMGHTQLNNYLDVLDGRASGYEKTDSGWLNVLASTPTLPFGAGAIVSNTRDLQRYMVALHSSDGISPKIKQSMLLQSRLNDGRLTFYTQGCQMVAEYEGTKKVGHGGGIKGFTAQKEYYPDSKIGIVVLTNSSTRAMSAGTIENGISNILFNAEALPKAQNIPPATFSRYIGNYRLETHGMMGDFKLFEQNKQLMIKLGGALLAQAPAMPLQRLGNNRLYLNAGLITLVLNFNDSGEAEAIVMNGMNFKVSKVTP